MTYIIAYRWADVGGLIIISGSVIGSSIRGVGLQWRGSSVNIRPPRWKRRVGCIVAGFQRHRDDDDDDDNDDDDDDDDDDEGAMTPDSDEWMADVDDEDERDRSLAYVVLSTDVRPVGLTNPRRDEHPQFAIFLVCIVA